MSQILMVFRRGGRIQDDDPNSVFGGRVGDVYKLGSSSGTDSMPSSSSRTGKKKGDMANLLEEMKVSIIHPSIYTGYIEGDVINIWPWWC